MENAVRPNIVNITLVGERFESEHLGANTGTRDVTMPQTALSVTSTKYYHFLQQYNKRRPGY